MAAKPFKALVTGGAGFIGSHLVHALTTGNNQVTVIDDLSSGNLSNLEGVIDKITFIQADITDPNIVAKAAGGCKYIFHLAAMVSVSRTVEEPLESSKINELATIGVLEAARHNKVKRVVLSSSSAVYGDAPAIPKKETMPPNPKSPYALQKLVNEHYAALYGQLYGIETVCLRYFNVYGPRQDPSSPYSGVISIFMKKAASNKRPVIYGDGKQTRDFIFVKDVVQANLLSAQITEAAGHVFNVGTGQMIDINVLWDLIAKLAGNEHRPQYVSERSGDIRQSVADIDKSIQMLGFSPQIKLSSGLEITYQWYRENT